MAIFTKESLELLRRRVDLTEVISSHIELKRMGSSYKACCPFHEEKSPSFVVQKGDSHYHCFGCGAHGDAIQFLMQYLRMSFLEAVQSLAERFHVPLETVDFPESKGPNRATLKEALQMASRFYQFYLLHTKEGHEALDYLYRRGIDLDFIRHFQVGLSPKSGGLMRAALKKVPNEILREAGLLTQNEQREFFLERIMFPIHNAAGNVIGFSARKYKDATFGGKYVNTPETVLFKKSHILFGLNYCRRRIAKERHALIVEGQIDALRLIQEGFNYTVAGQGTAFGEGHLKELMNLGVTAVYLAFDADIAGQEAASKVGNLFQKEGVEVYVLSLPTGDDPDTLLRNQGPDGFKALLDKKEDYLTFLVNHYSKRLDMESPASKTQLVDSIAEKIREWDNPLMVHESLRKLARLTNIPEEVLATNSSTRAFRFIKKSGSAGGFEVDPDRILETDLLRWLLLMGEEERKLVDIAGQNLELDHFSIPICRQIYQTYMSAFKENKPRDLLSLAIDLDDADAQLFLSDILQKRVKRERCMDHIVETVQKMLDRHWMHQREAIKQKIQSGNLSDDEAIALAKQFDDLRKNPPHIKGV
ncbi:MAG: DNA primase [Parachlamydiales bacterium]|nr:DNA primase [Parachlamydiales bacterium]